MNYNSQLQLGVFKWIIWTKVSHLFWTKVSQ